MKYLITFLFFSVAAQAANWMPLSKIQSGSSQAYELKSNCEKSGEQCLDLGDKPDASALGFTSLENDWSEKSEIENCISQIDCEEKLLAKSCIQGEKFIDAEYSEVYCTSLLGKKLVINLAGYIAAKAAKAQTAALESAIQTAKKLRECGGRVMDLMLVRNQPKGLSVSQVAQILQTYQPIQLQLSSGSLQTAKAAIQAVVADGVMVTESDKSALTQEIDKCLL